MLAKCYRCNDADLLVCFGQRCPRSPVNDHISSEKVPQMKNCGLKVCP